MVSDEQRFDNSNNKKNANEMSDEISIGDDNEFDDLNYDEAFQGEKEEEEERKSENGAIEEDNLESMVVNFSLDTSNKQSLGYCH